MDKIPPWALEPSKVFSTGQTLMDFIQLAALQRGLGGKVWSNTVLTLPPVLMYEDYVPTNRSTSLAVGFIILTIISCLLVFLRIYSRLTVTPKKLVLEDYTLVISIILLCGLTAVYCCGVYMAQWGMEMYDLTYESVLRSGQLIVAQLFLAVACIFTIRISAILFIRRLYVGSGSRVRTLCTYMVYLNLVLMVACEIAFIFGCGIHGMGRPLWDIRAQASRGVRCQTMQIIWAAGGINLACDTIAILLPLRVVAQMFSAPLWKRIRVFSLLGLGFTAWSGSIARLVYSKKYIATGSLSAVIDAFMANHVELVIAICCACLPAIQALISAAWFGKSEPMTPAAPQQDLENGNQHNGDHPSKEIDAIKNPAAVLEQEKLKKKGFGGRFNMPSLRMYGVGENSLFSTRHEATVRRPSVPMLEGIALEEKSDSDNEKSDSSGGPELKALQPVIYNHESRDM